MKKATIIISIISILIVIATIFVIRKMDNIVDEIALAEKMANSIRASSQSVESSVDDAANDHDFYYSSIDLDQEMYIVVNECMQFYIKDESFDNAHNCEEKIVDAIINEDGELSFIKSVIGDMLKYAKDDVSIDYNYINNLITSSRRRGYLKEKLTLAFVNRYRDPIKMQETFTKYKNYFYDFIPKPVYDKVYKEYVNSFIASYNEIHEKDDVEAFYKDIYFKAEKGNNQSKYWNYTFWKRRELEKNDRIIYNILNEINTHYAE